MRLLYSGTDVPFEDFWCCQEIGFGLNRTGHPDWVKKFGDSNGQIKLRVKQKFQFSFCYSILCICMKCMSLQSKWTLFFLTEIFFRFDHQIDLYKLDGDCHNEYYTHSLIPISISFKFCLQKSLNTCMKINHVNFNDLIELFKTYVAHSISSQTFLYRHLKMS